MKTKLIFFFIKKLSIKKLLNLIKVFTSYQISNLIKKPFRYGHPISVSIEISNYCNLRCPQCPVGSGRLKRSKGNTSFSTFRLIINQLDQYLLNCFLYFQGEPFLNPEIFRMIEYANKRNVFLATSTNGHYLSRSNAEKLVKSGLDYIIISVDGITQEVYEQYRVGGKLKIVLEGIKNLVEVRKKLRSTKPFIEVQTLVMNINEHQLKDIKRLVYSLGVDHFRLKSIQIYDFEHNNFLPSDKRFRRYKFNGKRWIRKKKLKNRCWRLWNSVVITWDGEVLPCCFDKDAEHSYGNIHNSPIKKLIVNSRFKNFAQQILTDRKQITICRNCTE